MSVYFISKDTEDTLLIGGQDSVTGVDSGGIGPFPKYSISREDIRTTDGTYINTKFNIQVTGTAVLKSADSQDMLTSGQRQSRVQGEALIKMQFNRTQWPMHGVGKLEIQPYGGLANGIVFNDARLTTMELPEQTDESAGVQNLEYSFAFEAYQDSSGAGENTGKDSAVDAPDYLLSSAEESWDLAPNEGTVAFKDNDMSNEPYLTFTLTHTLSATGLKKFATGLGLATDGDAWKQAVDWVGSRLTDNPDAAITTDLMGNAAAASFNPFYMDKDGISANVDYNLSTDYKVYNHVRTVSSDQAAGSYSVTDTWLVSEQTQSVTHDVEISVESGEEARANTINMSGTIQGLSIQGPGKTLDDKYTRALAALDTVLASSYAAANSVYVSSGFTGTLRTIQNNKSVGHSKGSGTITWSIGYDDLVVSCEGALTEEVTITDDNYDGSNQVIAIIGVIGNESRGPVMQDMGATTERKRSISIDIVMSKGNRGSKPTCGDTIADSYMPVPGIDARDGPFQQSKTESWGPLTGSYNLSITWVYNGY